MPDIEITIHGIIVMLFKRDQQGDPTDCVLGVVDGVPDHEVGLVIKKNMVAIPIDPTTVTELKLDVQNTTLTGIRFFDPKMINRVTDTPTKSASWILEFEDELYTTPPATTIGLGVTMANFRPIFRINNGEIFADEVSRNHLLCRSEGASPSDPFTLVGKVATVVGLRTDLDLVNSEAHLFDGTAPIVDVAHGDRLTIELSLACPSCTQTGQVSGHANHYYRAIGTNLVWGQKLLFSSTQMPPLSGLVPPISPEASCLVGQLGRTIPT